MVEREGMLLISAPVVAINKLKRLMSPSSPYYPHSSLTVCFSPLNFFHIQLQIIGQFPFIWPTANAFTSNLSLLNALITRLLFTFSTLIFPLSHRQVGPIHPATGPWSNQLDAKFSPNPFSS